MKQTISIPNTGRKRAIIVVDMQPTFLSSVPKSLVSAVVAVLENVPYDVYVEATFHADKGSIWDKQTGWTYAAEPSVPEIQKALQEKPIEHISKSAKSAFLGDKDLAVILRAKGIEEVHIVGVDTNDCILATAYNAFDLGFFAYVIEECVSASEGSELHEAALKILRNVDLTNHSKRIASNSEVSI
ncbi:MAG TPA: isochorismatase family cysteine hydrolase [Candidatus Paceibacterota bacterium]|nr:isochorismatase family cysteine hydrolase [Candidatus Paceibacterota bacterium]